MNRRYELPVTSPEKLCIKSRVTNAAGEANRRNLFWKPSLVKRCQWLLFAAKYRAKKRSRSALQWWKLEKRECRPGYNVFDELETFIDVRIEVTNAPSINECANRYLRKWFVALARLTRRYYKIFVQWRIYLARGKILWVARWESLSRDLWRSTRYAGGVGKDMQKNFKRWPHKASNLYAPWRNIF